MKHTLSYVSILTFIELTLASTFVVNVETDTKNGTKYIEYEGERFYLTDDPAEKETAFLRKDCIVKVKLSKANMEFQRPGSALCKADYEKFGATDWKEFADAQVMEINNAFAVV